VSAIRYTRQVRLAEVGEAGQARLRESELAVRGGGVAGAIEARYLAGAGVGSLRVRDALQEEAARAVDGDVRVRVDDRAGALEERSPLDALRMDPAAYDVAIGAWRALDALREVLGVKPMSMTSPMKSERKSETKSEGGA
jgi:hypothetical protein